MSIGRLFFVVVDNIHGELSACLLATYSMPWRTIYHGAGMFYFIPRKLTNGSTLSLIYVGYMVPVPTACAQIQVLRPLANKQLRVFDAIDTFLTGTAGISLG
jgi:hypothetical protein